MKVRLVITCVPDVGAYTVLEVRRTVAWPRLPVAGEKVVIAGMTYIVDNVTFGIDHEPVPEEEPIVHFTRSEMELDDVRTLEYLGWVRR